MNKYFIFGIGLLSGTAAGFFIGKMFYKKKYEYIANEEIESVRQSYNDISEKSGSSFVEITEKVDPKEELADIKSYREIVNNNYKEKRIIDDSEERPYIISPDRFGEEVDQNGNEYATVTLICYKDGVITYDDTNDIFKDAYEMLGCDPLEHFGEYEEYTVYVRNDRYSTDFEILYEPNAYNPEPYED